MVRQLESRPSGKARLTCLTVRVGVTVIALLPSLIRPVPARAADVAKHQRFTASDGVSLQTTIAGEAPLRPRPVIVEFTPYGRQGGSDATRVGWIDAGKSYNYLLVQIRGTGDSDGRFDGLGDRTQADVVEVLRWACRQPWSDGNLALAGYSASAIVVYNSLHLELPCVRTAVLKSGTFEVYRDLLYPGGINQYAITAGVLALFLHPAAAQLPERLARDPRSTLGVAEGLTKVWHNAFIRPTIDSWWRERSFRGDVNDLPILMIDSFFDVESRGAFQGFQALGDDGARLLVVGAHDGVPEGTDGGHAETKVWLDHYLGGVGNGMNQRPKVTLLLADGDREDYLAGKFVRFNASDWPVPGTRWESLALDPTRSGMAATANDGSLTLDQPGESVIQSYAELPSSPTSTDPANAATLGPVGVNQLSGIFPPLTEMTLAESLGLSYTTKPFATDVLSAGPMTLELRLSSTAPETGIWAVVSDVSPDGTAHPVAAGRLLSAFPRIDRDKSLTDSRTGDIVQPYGIYDRKDPADIGEERLYRVEFWPIGNRFKKGHRLRLHILGTSALSVPRSPAINSIRVGGPKGSRLLFPVLPGSNLSRALR